MRKAGRGGAVRSVAQRVKRQVRDLLILTCSKDGTQEQPSATGTGKEPRQARRHIADADQQIRRVALLIEAAANL